MSIEIVQHIAYIPSEFTPPINFLNTEVQEFNP